MRGGAARYAVELVAVTVGYFLLAKLGTDARLAASEREPDLAADRFRSRRHAAARLPGVARDPGRRADRQRHHRRLGLHGRRDRDRQYARGADRRRPGQPLVRRARHLRDARRRGEVRADRPCRGSAGERDDRRRHSVHCRICGLGEFRRRSGSPGGWAISPARWSSRRRSCCGPRAARSSPGAKTWASSAAILAATCLVGLLAFSPLIDQTPIRDPLGFLAIVPLLWAALRRGQRETATVALLLACFAIWGTLARGGPFARPNLNDSFLLLLMFMISTTVPSLALSATMARRRLVEASLGAALDVERREARVALDVTRGAACPGAEARGARPAHRRHRARLQQPLDDRRRPRADPAAPAAADRPEGHPGARGDPHRREARRDADAPAADLRAPAEHQSRGGRPARAHRRHPPDAVELAARQHRAGLRSGCRGVAGRDRHRRVRARARQHRDQCARRHAGRRHAQPAGAQRRSRPWQPSISSKGTMCPSP